MFGADAFLVAACYFVSFMIRFEFSPPGYEWENLWRILPWVIPVKMTAFVFFRLYRGLWRYTSLQDLWRIGQAVFSSSSIIVLAVLMLNRFHGVSRSVFLIDAVLTLMAIGGVRVAVRLYYSVKEGGMGRFFPLFLADDRGRKRLIIVGAGNLGEKVLREIIHNPSLRLTPIGFLDDSPAKVGLNIHGVPVIGTIDELDDPSIEFDEILIAMDTAGGERMRRLVDLCERSGKRYRTMPVMGELIGGKVSLTAIREVSLEDLLGRSEVVLDQAAIAGYLGGKRVLITGAGGSIGSELVRQASRFQPSVLGLLDISEFNLFKVGMDYRHLASQATAREFLADIRNRESMDRVFRELRPQVVFHAAAYKHVFMQETHPWEAVLNNVLGTRIVAETARDHQVERFVLVSTDKAVRPTNVMGATKRVAEMLVACMNGSTQFMAVRFGNVMGSSGSVIPIFKEQIARGGPVTVTHPEVTRYFMSVPEAAQLILQAGAIGRGGEIFILEMGDPVRVLDMARDLIRLHGWEPERDIPIEFIGLRSGEKLYEELITEGEGIMPTGHDKIMVLRGNECAIEPLIEKIDGLIVTAATYDAEAIRDGLKGIVPEYAPENNSD
ncbi:MAG: polysaccharide biosynthesis protein [Proteobacteria bacterium]|nr:polysaccharide biosynthesis protein [Pseudomonadota bacterium]